MSELSRALRQQLDQNRIVFTRLEGALADAGGVPTDDLEGGIRALASKVEQAEAEVVRLVAELEEQRRVKEQAEARVKELEIENRRVKDENLLVSDALYADDPITKTEGGVMPLVVRISDNLAGAIRVDRKTMWGNPFIMRGEAERDLVCNLFEEYAQRRIQEEPTWLDALRGKDLACWCAPKRCHADTLLFLANQAEPRGEEDSNEA